MKYDGRTIRQWAGDSQWRAWKADLARFRASGHSGFFSEGFWALTLYRLEHTLRRSRARRLLWPPWVVVRIARKLLTMVTHIHLHPDAEIGPGLLIPHVGPVRVSAWTRIGADCAIHHVCTLGAGTHPGGPTLGDHVMVGAHSCILGPVTVGDGARIGAGAVVVTDIPAGATAVGVPARVVGEEPSRVPASGARDRSESPRAESW